MVIIFPDTFFISCNSSNENTSKSKHVVDTVNIQRMQFIPAVLKTNIGDSVVWINNDIVSHDVKSKIFYSDTLNVGKSWKWVVKDSADYQCSIHPTMTGKIVLK